MDEYDEGMTDLEQEKGADVVKEKASGGKFFYGWIIVAVAWLIYLFNVAMPLYGGNVINSIMVLDTGMSEESLGLAVTLHTALCGVAGPAVGVLIKKRGHKQVYIIGSILTLVASLGYLFLPMNGFLLVLFFGILVALGIGVGGTLCTQSLVIQWFEKNQAMAMAFTLTAGAVGGFIAPIIMNAASDAGGWKAGWIVMAAGVIIAILLSFIFVKDHPEEIGEVKDGHAFHAKAAAAGANSKAKTSKKTAERPMPYSMTLKESMRTKEFYFLIIVSAFRTALYYSILGYVVVYAVSSGIEKTTAALVVSAISITSLVGRLLTGVMGKAGIPVKIIMMISAASTAASGILLFIGGAFPVFALAGMCAGFGFGIAMVVSPMFFSYYFGPENFSIIYGAVSPVSTIIGAVGPSAAGALALALNSYAVPFLGMGLANVVCAVLCLFMTVDKKRYGTAEPVSAAEAEAPVDME